MSSNKIDVDAFVNSSLIEQAEIDTVFHSVDVHDNEYRKLLTVSSIYLHGLNAFQNRYRDFHNIPYESDSLEGNMVSIYSCLESGLDQSALKRLFTLADEDLKYVRSLRRDLIELGIIPRSQPDETQPRSEFLALQQAFETNDLSSMYKRSRQISLEDFEDFTEAEKSIVLKVLQVDSYGVSIAISMAILDDTKIKQTEWFEFWNTVSSYKPGDTLEEIRFLNQKALCIDSNYVEETINMKMFPNLPEIRNYDGEIDLKAFSDSIDWNKKFYPHEIDFILASAITLNEDRDSIFLEWEQEQIYIEIRKELHQKADRYIAINNFDRGA